MAEKQKTPLKELAKAVPAEAAIHSPENGAEENGAEENGTEPGGKIPLGDAAKAAFAAAHIPDFGVCAFSAVADRLLPCRAAARLPKGARSVLIAAFPYRFPETGAPRNLSRYASVKDYHRVVPAALEQVAAALKAAAPRGEFAVFCDNSPIPEREAAAMAGLGMIGDNGLLIHPVFGSYLFLGEIVTDRLLTPTGSGRVEGCIHCGACGAACPTDSIRRGTAKAETCLSAITQKKGDLTPAEQAAVRQGGLCWGCDRCQEVCPCNRTARVAPYPGFSGETPRLTAQDLEDADLTFRAYGWRGAAPLKRNLAILGREEAAHGEK